MATLGRTSLSRLPGDGPMATCCHQNIGHLKFIKFINMISFLKSSYIRSLDMFFHLFFILFLNSLSSSCCFRLCFEVKTWRWSLFQEALREVGQIGTSSEVVMEGSQVCIEFGIIKLAFYMAFYCFCFL